VQSALTQVLVDGAFGDADAVALRLDDCAMLAGLLAVLLSGKRWNHFYRAVTSGCTAQYKLSEQDRRDLDGRARAELRTQRAGIVQQLRMAPPGTSMGARLGFETTKALL
jgi:hypothetical protein